MAASAERSTFSNFDLLSPQRLRSTERAMRGIHKHHFLTDSDRPEDSWSWTEAQQYSHDYSIAHRVPPSDSCRTGLVIAVVNRAIRSSSNRMTLRLSKAASTG
ncbi:hypothetical protein AC579_1911 [Pseudocercospora musae]|uniref:Uncharacterized protein n=1 Tax=Pseudocercospora musae TaxID=113226 RepID=A0A139HFH5_9PEZI|nr:hypothetical protein AC579_1911 [Pseudocercospora musae]